MLLKTAQLEKSSLVGQDLLWTMVWLSSSACASVWSKSLSFFRGKVVESSKAPIPGESDATCARSCSTVWLWFALTILRLPSCMRICSVVVGAASSSTSAAASVGGAASLPLVSVGSRIDRPLPEKGLSVGGGGLYGSAERSIKCTSLSAEPSAPMSSAGIRPRLTSLRKAAFSGSCMFRRGPSSTVKPFCQNVMVCSCARSGLCSPAVVAPLSDWPAPVKALEPAAWPAFHSSALSAPCSSRARFIRSRGSSTSWPLPPPLCPWPPA
mmetsp:Transcript_1809/g.3723  ORF Transcript_1809/g.3723 Transcript_1809/m.3723 type:complete len:268 (+) Transcript_1809:1015-1818(+)